MAGMFVSNFSDPSRYPKSDTFRAAINDHLNKVGLDWINDPNGNNQPDPGELTVAQNYLKNYDVTKATPDLFNQEINQEVYRAFMTHASNYTQNIYKMNSEYEHRTQFPTETMAQLTKIEQAAAYKTATELGPIFNQLFILQENSQTPLYLHAFRQDLVDNNVPPEAWNFLSHIMTDSCPTPFNKTLDHCSLFPVPIDKPGVSSMLPRNMTSTDWSFVAKAYEQYDKGNTSIFRPDTVIDWSYEKPQSLVALSEKKGELEATIQRMKEYDALCAEECSSDEKLAAEMFHPSAKAAKTRLENELKALESRYLESLVGSVKALAMPLHPRFRGVCLKISEKANEIAELKIKQGDQVVAFKDTNPETYDHLRAVANYFKNGSAAEAEVLMWTLMKQSEGQLRISITPGTESYWGDNTKFAAMMWVAVIDDSVKEIGEKYASVMLKGVDQVMVDNTSYKGEGDKKAALTEIVDVIYYGGFLSAFQHGTPAGWNLPNYPYKTITDKELTVANNVLTYRKNRTLIKSLVGEYANYVTPFGTAYFVCAHENGHFVGPSRGYVTPKGDKMGAIFGERWGWADEPKADLNALSSVRIALENGSMNLERAKEIFFTILFWTMKNQIDSKDIEVIAQDHTIGNLAELGMWFEEGLFSMEPKPDGGYMAKINMSAADKVSKEELLGWLRKGEALEKRIVELQSLGAKDDYLKMAQDYVNQIPDTFVDYIKASRAENKVSRGFLRFRMTKPDYQEVK